MKNKYFIINFSVLIIVSFVINVRFAAFADISNKPVVVISIDAETTSHDNLSITLPDQLDLKIDQIECGITKMMDICDKHDVKATFFLNVYEYKKYGEAMLKKIAKFMDVRGFDVQLHTHPQWAYDNKRNMMYQYSLNEQIEIIKDGRSLIKKWIGKDTVIHRAGAYSANEDTLKALNENQIFYDSSFRYKYPTCLLQDLDLKKNFISISTGVYQIPVNVFYLERYAKWLNFLRPFNVIVKYDIDSIDSETMIKAIDKGIEHQFDVIVLFLHSYSFINEYTEDNKVPDIVDIQEFDDVLDYIKKKGLEIVTFGSFIDQFNKEKFVLGSTDLVPTVNTEISPFKFFAKKIGVNKGNIREVITYTIVISIILMAAIAYFVNRRKNARNITYTS